jgi:hypothetical protein
LRPPSERKGKWVINEVDTTTLGMIELSKEKKITPWKLRFLYMGSASVKNDLKFYRDVIGAKLLWHSKHFGAEVAAFSFGDDQPLLLLQIT